MSEPVKPAMTAEEWQAKNHYPAWLDLGFNRLHVSADDAHVEVDQEDRHAIAALALYGQPFGFNPPKSVGGYNTPDYVDAIRFCAEELDRLLRTTAYGMQVRPRSGGQD